MLSQFYAILPLLTSLVLAGELQIKQDTSVSATKGHKDGQYVWTSIADLEKKDKISDGELMKIAHEASLEMRSSWDSAPKAKRPSVMTVMEIDNQLYMASSMKGDYSFIYEYKTNNGGGHTADGTVRKSVPKEIAEALGNAKSGSNRNNVQHKNDASCGELMASYTYLLKNSGQSLKSKKPKRTIAWLHTTDREGKTVTDKAWDPCGTDDKESWGCDMFCNKMNFDPVKIADTKEAKDVPKVSKTTQQKLMTPQLRKELDEMNKQADEANKKKQQEKAEQKKKEKEEKEKKEKDDKKDDKKEEKEEKKDDKKQEKEEKKDDKKDEKKDKKGKKGGKREVTARSWSA